MATAKVRQLLKQINNDPELAALLKAGGMGNYESEQEEGFIPCYGRQSFTQGQHTYYREYVSTPEGSLKFTGRVFS